MLRISLAAVALMLATSTAFAAPMVKNGILVDDQGMTLYTFDKDEPGVSKCEGPCLANWPAAVVAAGEAAHGEFSQIVRADGTKQWAYDGKPLYRWIKDAKSGDMTGDGVKDVWHVVKMDGYGKSR